jgi:hypothetical protein
MQGGEREIFARQQSIICPNFGVRSAPLRKP